MKRYFFGPIILFILAWFLSSSTTKIKPVFFVGNPYKDTIMNGWVCRIRPGTVGTKEVVWFLYGSGQTGNGTLGNDTAFFSQFGFEWDIINNGWDQQATLGNGVHRPTIVSVIQPGNSGFTPPIQFKATVDAFLASRFANPGMKGNMSIAGFSAGGWLSMMFNGMTFSSTTDTSAFNYFHTVIDMQGVISNDVSGATIGYPQRFGHRAKVSSISIHPFRYVGIEGTFDESRDIWGRRDNMLDSVPGGQFYGIWTVDGGGAHCCWNDYINHNQNNFTASNPLFITSHDGETSNFLPGGQNLVQFMLRGGDTTFAGGLPPPPICSAGSPGQMQLPTSTATLTGTATAGSGGSIAIISWTTLVNPDSVTITSPNSLTTGLTELTAWGNYVFQLIVTDNFGQKDTSTVRLNVLPACNLIASITYTQGANSGAGIDLDARSKPWRGGDTIVIDKHWYPFITMYDFSGDPCHPIYVDLRGVKTTVFSFNTHTQYVKFFGLEVDSGNTCCAVTGSLFNHIDIDSFYVDSTGPGSAGMFIKTTPDPTKPETIYPNSQNTKLHIHNSRIRKPGDEAIYAGSTSPDLQDAGQPPYVPPRLDSVEIDHMIIDSAGWDAIQLSGALDGNLIHHNIITHYGVQNQSSQQAGIILGAKTRGDIFNNVIRNGTGNAIQVFGYGIINIHDNVIDSAGRDGTTNGQESILTNDQLSITEVVPGQITNIFNNQVFRPRPNRAAIHFYNASGTTLASVIHDNTFCIPLANPATWQSTYIITSPPATITNNTLLIDCNPISNSQLLLFRRGKFILNR